MWIVNILIEPGKLLWNKLRNSWIESKLPIWVSHHRKFISFHSTALVAQMRCSLSSLFEYIIFSHHSTDRPVKTKKKNIHKFVSVPPNLLYVLVWLKSTFTRNPKKLKTQQNTFQVNFRLCEYVTNVFDVFRLIVVGNLAHATKNIRETQTNSFKRPFRISWIRGTHSVCIRKLNWFWIMLFSLTDAGILIFFFRSNYYRIVSNQLIIPLCFSFTQNRAFVTFKKRCFLLLRSFKSKSLFFTEMSINFHSQQIIIYSNDATSKCPSIECSGSGSSSNAFSVRRSRCNIEQKWRRKK